MVVARGGDDVWTEIRRRRVPDDDRVPDDMFGPSASPPESHDGDAIALAAADEEPLQFSEADLNALDAPAEARGTAAHEAVAPAAYVTMRQPQAVMSERRWTTISLVAELRRGSSSDRPRRPRCCDEAPNRLSIRDLDAEIDAPAEPPVVVQAPPAEG